MSKPPSRLIGAPLGVSLNIKAARAASVKSTVSVAKVLLPAAIKISGMANDKHSKALGFSAINFMTSNISERNKHANRLVNAMVNYYLSPGNFSPRAKNMAAAALNKVKIYAPAHYNSVRKSVVRKAPGIAGRVVGHWFSGFRKIR